MLLQNGIAVWILLYVDLKITDHRNFSAWCFSIWVDKKHVGQNPAGIFSHAFVGRWLKRITEIIIDLQALNHDSLSVKGEIAGIPRKGTLQIYSLDVSLQLLFFWSIPTTSQVAFLATCHTGSFKVGLVGSKKPAGPQDAIVLSPPGLYTCLVCGDSNLNLHVPLLLGKVGQSNW